MAACLDSVRDVVDEICVVDTGSTDGTRAIAQAYGARVRSLDWNDDFSAARNASLAMATQPWILVLDADERVAPESLDALRALWNTPPDGRGRWVRCHNVSDDVRGGATSTNAIVRIFPNEPDIRYRGVLHEFVARTGDDHSLPAVTIPVELHHYGYTSEVFAARDKAGRNLRLAQAALAADPRDPFHHYNYAMSALQNGDVATAARELAVVCDMTEGQPRGFRPQALATLASLQIDTDLRAALATAGRCVTIAPTFPDGHFVRGRALAALGRLHEARDAFGSAIGAGRYAAEHFVTDEEIPAWRAAFETALTLMREERWTDALAWLDLAQHARPVLHVVLNRARCYEQRGDLADALATFRAALDGFRDELAAVEYVNFVFRHGSPDIALLAVEHALPLVGADYQRAFLATAAAGFVRAGRRDDAEANVARALEVGGNPALGRAVVDAMAEYHGVGELRTIGRDRLEVYG